MIEIFTAFLAGASAKVYDDGVDMNMITNEYHKKILETLQCFLLGALSMNNFTFSLVNLVINLLSYFANKDAYEQPYESSLLVVYPIFLLLSFGTRDYLKTADIIFFLILAGVLFFEPLVVKEEKSPRKFVFRLLSSLVFFAFLFLNANISSGIYLIIVYIFAYSLISTIYQGYHVSGMKFSLFAEEAIKGTQDLIMN